MEGVGNLWIIASTPKCIRLLLLGGGAYETRLDEKQKIHNLSCRKNSSRGWEKQDATYKNFWFG